MKGLYSPSQNKYSQTYLRREPQSPYHAWHNFSTLNLLKLVGLALSRDRCGQSDNEFARAIFVTEQYPKNFQKVCQTETSQKQNESLGLLLCARTQTDLNRCQQTQHTSLTMTLPHHKLGDMIFRNERTEDLRTLPGWCASLRT